MEELLFFIWLFHNLFLASLIFSAMTRVILVMMLPTLPSRSKFEKSLLKQLQIYLILCSCGISSWSKWKIVVGKMKPTMVYFTPCSCTQDGYWKHFRMVMSDKNIRWMVNLSNIWLHETIKTFSMFPGPGNMWPAGYPCTLYTMYFHNLCFTNWAALID